MTFFDMGRQGARDEREFGIWPIGDLATPRFFTEIEGYSIIGHSENGVVYIYECGKHGTKLTYHRPRQWTDEDWEQFCDEMEEDICGDQASNE